MSENDDRRSIWSSKYDFVVVCPCCKSVPYRLVSVKTHVAYRCSNCNVRFEVTNPSYLRKKPKRKEAED